MYIHTRIHMYTSYTYIFTCYKHNSHDITRFCCDKITGAPEVKSAGYGPPTEAPRVGLSPAQLFWGTVELFSEDGLKTVENYHVYHIFVFITTMEWMEAHYFLIR